MEHNRIINIAFILSSYNRFQTTLECIRKIYEPKFSADIKTSIYLFDDDSNDGTPAKVKSKYPRVNLIRGNGSSYWGHGMNYAWLEASKKDYDYYIWINDDTLLFDNWETLVFSAIQSSNSDETIFVGTTESNNSKTLTYGGRKSIKDKIINPNGMYIDCKIINGNFVIISQKIFIKIGCISWPYKHSLGDIDYGLRASKAGFEIKLLPEIIGYCENHIEDKIDFSSLNLFQRLKKLNSIKNVPFYPYLRFNFIHFGVLRSLLFAFTYLLLIIFPSIYYKLKK